jgi:hypothetical protein
MLRACLRVTSQPLAAIASRAIWEGIIRHDYPGIAATSWHAVTVQTKRVSGLHGSTFPVIPRRPERARQFVDEAADVKGKASRRTAS